MKRYAAGFALVLLLVPASGIAQPQVETFASRLDFPTNLAFSPDGRVFLTEKNTGAVRIIQDGRLLRKPFVTVP